MWRLAIGILDNSFPQSKKDLSWEKPMQSQNPGHCDLQCLIRSVLRGPKRRSFRLEPSLKLQEKL